MKQIHMIVVACWLIVFASFASDVSAGDESIDKLIQDASTALEKKDFDQAIKLADKACDLETSEHRAMVIKGKAYLGKGEFKRADETFFSDLAGKCPGDEEAQIVALQKQAIAGEVEQAKKELVGLSDPKIIEKQWQRIAELTERVDDDQAIALYTKLITDYGPGWALRERGNIYIDKKDYKNALADYKEFLLKAKDLGNPRAVIEWAATNMEVPERITVLSAVLERLPDQPEALWYRAIAYRLTGQTKRAVADFRRGYRGAKNPVQYQWMVNLQDHKTQYKARNPDEAAKHLAIATALAMEQKHNEVIAECKKAIAADVDCYEAYLKMGDAQVALELYTDALATFDASEHAGPMGHSMSIVMISETEKKAIPALEEAIRLNPKDPKPLLLLADHLAAQRKKEKPIELYKKAAELLPEDQTILNRLWKVQIFADQYVPVSDHCTDILAKDDQDADALFARAQVYAVGQNNEAALADAKKTLAIDPTFYDARKMIRDIHAQAKDWDALEKLAREEIDRDPNDPTWSWALGDAAWGRKDFAYAKTCYEAAAKKDPHNADTFGYLAQICIEADKIDLACESYVRQLDCRPEDYDKALEIGNFLRYHGKLKEAAHAFEVASAEAVPNTPGDEAAEALAEVRYALGDYTKAVKAYDQSLAHMENNYVWWHRSIVLIKMGKARQVLEGCETRLKEWPDSDCLYLARAGAYRAIGENEKAAADYTKALKIAPDFSAALLAMANFKFETEKYVDAIQLFDQLLKAEPDDAELIHKRAYSYLKKYAGTSARADLGVALAGWKRCVELEPSSLMYKRNYEIVAGVVKTLNMQDARHAEAQQQAAVAFRKAAEREREENSRRMAIERQRFLEATDPQMYKKEEPKKDFFDELTDAVHNLGNSNNSGVQNMVDQNWKAGSELQQRMTNERRSNERMHEIERKFNR